MRYCKECEQNVRPTKKFNWLAFFLLMGVFYIPVYMFKSYRCPICGSKL